MADVNKQKQLASTLDDLAVTGRLQDLALFTVEGRSDRAAKIRQVLSTLDAGVYLLGAGPYSQAIVPLRCDEIVIGRLATPLEPILDKAVDVFVNDAVGLLPREVSRVHCAVHRREGVESHDYWLIDKGSSCGTFLNGERLDQPSSDAEQELIRASRPLAHGDVISLGPSKINTFLFADLRLAMYCVGCSAQNPDAGVFCFNCGRELVVSPAAGAVQHSTPVADGTSIYPAVSSQSPELQPGAAVETIRNEYPNLVGVGGWLLWFCIVTTIISPAIVLVSTLSHPSGYSLIDVCLAAFSVFTGVSLWKAKPQALRLTKILLVIQFCLGALLFIGELISSTTDSSTSSNASDPSGLRMLVFASIWFLYFRKSKRVRIVYGRAI